MQKTIRINPKLTFNQIGVKESIFKAHFEGKDLPVIGREKDFYTVIAGGEEFTVHASDVDRCHHTAAHEELNKKDNCVVEALKRKP